ncbi:MAG: hypothetical protein HOC70_03695 [Gammaproteobacteria bacterium]|nr:hypothetical protein [Gammaproteobacteria bacterium]MBT7371821.1 hypothetical protein [Gammaproteobacteria bacterium]
MNIAHHLIAFISATVVAINLAFWLIWLMLLALLKLIFRNDPIRHWINLGTEWCYRRTVGVHNFWMFQVVGVRLHVTGELPDHPSPIILSNHQTWMDIPVLHGVITKKGPTLKFLIKRELLWVPIIGWICYALSFPRLNRGKGSGGKTKDFAAIQAFSSSLHTERGALMNFAEGTRFTEQKHENQNSPYQHLLVPRPGGLKIALETAPAGTPVIDVTVVYDGPRNFWQCLGGRTKDIKVVIRTYDSSEILNVRSWLDARWQEKDKFFEAP